MEKQEKKIQKERKAELKTQRRIRDKLWHTERDEIHQQDLDARKCEWEWKKKVKTLQKTKQAIPPELQMPILDPEAVYQEELKRLFPPHLYEKDEDEEEIEIIVNTAGDKSLLQDSIALQHDYIALSEDSENLSNSSDSSNSSSEESVYSM